MARALSELRLPRLLETDRLRIAAPRAEDGSALTAAIAESLTELARFFQWAQTMERWGDPEDMADRARAAAERFVDAEDPAWFVWTRGPTPELVGELVLATGEYEDHGAVEFFVWIRTSRHGRGYASEAAAALFDWCFTHGEVELIEARVAGNNAGSRRLMLKLGMAPMGYLSHHPRFVVFNPGR